MFDERKTRCGWKVFVERERERELLSWHELEGVFESLNLIEVSECNQLVMGCRSVGEFSSCYAECCGGHG